MTAICASARAPLGTPPPAVPSVTSEERRYARNDHAPGVARQFIRAQLLEWGLDHLLDDTMLVVSELVTNAVLYADGDEVAVRAEMSGGVVCVRVRDVGPGLPERRNAAGDDESGRGLVIVTALALEWGTYRVAGGGKVTWATIDGAPAAGSPAGSPAAGTGAGR